MFNYYIMLSQTAQNEIPYIDVVSIVVPAIISIVGFIITYKQLNSSFKNELNKQKSSVHIEKMSTIPFDILMFLETIINSSRQGMDENTFKENLNKIYNTIYSYGTHDAIKIITTMQKENYLGNEGNHYRVMALYVLLATQIKFDVTGILISPNYWYELKITDYKNNKNMFKEINNIIIQELNLNKALLIN